MFNFSQNNLPSLGVVFPDGVFYLSSFKTDSNNTISYFKVKGVSSNFGYFRQTKIISDYNNDYLIEVNARRAEISGILFDGRINEQQNTKSFFKNNCVASQYTNIQMMWWQNVGGKCLHLIDTLDTHINQFYANKCTGNVIFTEWSDTVSGSWNHVTAIELSNFNIQYCTTSPVFDMQRATQCIMKNGWIEHTEYPGNISNGQWLIDALSMEDCSNPLYCRYSRIIFSQLNLQAGASYDFNSGADESWLSLWESGYVRQENHGILIDGSLSTNYQTHEIKINNNTSTTNWFYAGYIYLPNVGEIVKLRVIASRDYSSVSNIKSINVGNTSQGEGIIYLQRLASNQIECSWDGAGACPLVSVKFSNPASTDIHLYLQVSSWIRNAIILCETNSLSRFNSGLHFRFERASTLMTSDEIDNIADLKTALCQSSFGVKAGVGWNDDGDLLFKGKVSNNKLSVIVNGKQYYIQLATS